MKRVLTTLALVPLAVYSIFFAPLAIFTAVVILFAVLCFLEYNQLVQAYGLPSVAVPGFTAGAVLIAYPAAWPVLSLAVLAWAMRHPLKHFLPASASLALGVLYVFGAWRCAVDLRTIDPTWVLFALAVNWVGDIAALYTGRTFGKHKLAPAVSPGKSWEGAAGSMVAALIFGWVFATYINRSVPVSSSIALAGLANIAGQMGDLAESALKRGAGVKDSGTLLPGHGGVLDRLDSSLFTMPLVWSLLSSPLLRDWFGLAPL
jgi:phosphatidate cytidylyltransferase